MPELRLNGNSVPWVMIGNAGESKDVREIQIRVEVGAEYCRQAGPVSGEGTHPWHRVDCSSGQQHRHKADDFRLRPREGRR